MVSGTVAISFLPAVAVPLWTGVCGFAAATHECHTVLMFLVSCVFLPVHLRTPVLFAGHVCH